MWNRTYGKEKFANLYDKYHACSQLNMMLELTGCKRLVIGHTPQVEEPCTPGGHGTAWRRRNITTTIPRSVVQIIAIPFLSCAVPCKHSGSGSCSNE